MPQNHAKFYISNGNNIGLATTLIELQKWLISYSQILKMFWLGMFTRKQVGLEWWSIGLNDLNRKNMNHSNNILTPFFNCMDDVKNLHVNLTKEIRVYISELQTKNENDKKKFN